MTLRQFNENIRSIMANKNLHSFSERLAAAMVLAKDAQINFSAEYRICPQCGGKLVEGILNHEEGMCTKCKLAFPIVLDYDSYKQIGTANLQYDKSPFNCAATNRFGVQCRVQVKEEGQLCYHHRTIKKYL